ncbi:MAG TPA: hypothetical protein VHO71_06765 [Caproiciproducens sp.]|nr:hypothetical protein [Caproiciproducens sp.]
MAGITDIRKSERPIRVNGRTVMDVNYNDRYFSMWVYAAGQENGLEASPPSIQLDKTAARRLFDFLSDFIAE